MVPISHLPRLISLKCIHVGVSDVLPTVLIAMHITTR